LAVSLEELKSQVKNLFQKNFTRQSDIRNQLQMSMARQIPANDLGFGVTLAEHCNLNCCGCDHFAPLAAPEFADFDRLKKDFERLADLFGHRVSKINFLGGEPLLHPDITKFLSMTRRIFPKIFLDVMTNGILLPSMPKDFWTVCHYNGVVIRITKYPIALDFEKIENLAKTYDVDLRYYSDRNEINAWRKLKLDFDGMQDERRMFVICSRVGSCTYLQNGRLYPCTVAPTVRHFDKRFGTELFNATYNSIDIYKATSAEEILNFLVKPIPFCRFCNVAATECIPWQRSKKTIDEWT
jgi:MoaA/NifB/PqqE/SkfB family radical SAM enzyme